MSSGREPYAIAGAATRYAIERAVAAHVSTAAYRVLLAVLYHTASWSKLEDSVFLDGLAQVMGLHGTRTVSRGLKELQEAGVIVYKPGRGPGQTSRIELPAPGKHDNPDVDRHDNPDVDSRESTTVLTESTPTSVRKHDRRWRTTEKTSENPPDTRGRTSAVGVERALTLLAERDVERARRSGVTIISPGGFTAKSRASRERDHRDTLEALAAEHPDWTAAELADGIDPPSPPKRTGPCPDCGCDLDSPQHRYRHPEWMAGWDS